MVNKKIFIHGGWILLCLILTFSIINLIITSFKYPDYKHIEEYVCIDKHITSSRYGEQFFHIIAKNIENGKMYNKSVTLNTYYETDINDHIFFSEYYSDITEKDLKKNHTYAVIAIVSVIVLGIYLFICDSKDYL